MSDENTRTVRWAIMGTGSIANDMVQILKQLPNTEVLAVGSRSVEGAKRFGDRWGIPRQYGSYEEAAEDKVSRMYIDVYVQLITYAVLPCAYISDGPSLHVNIR